MEFGDVRRGIQPKNGPRMEVGYGWVNGRKGRVMKVIEGAGSAPRKGGYVMR